MSTTGTDIQTREPEIFAAGDSLVFQRYLPQFEPINGWSLHYVLSNLNGNEVLTFDSVQSPNNADAHLVDIDNFAAAVPQGEYVLTGQAVNVSGEKHQIYYGSLKLQPDLAAGVSAGPVETEAQEMIRMLRCQLRLLYNNIIQETEAQRTRNLIVKRDEVLNHLKYWKEVRASEIQMERARNGKQPGNVIIPVLYIG